MLTPLLLALLTAAPHTERSERWARPDARDRRVSRILPAVAIPTSSLPVFAFATSSGAGMGTECAGSVPTGTNGETMTFTRASSATCMKADGTGVTVTSNQPAIQVRPYAHTAATTGSGRLGIVVESSASTNLALDSEDFTTANWVPVGTATITAAAFASPFDNGGAMRGAKVTCAAAGDGVQQTILTTGQNYKAFSVWLRHSTLTGARSVTMSLTGIGDAGGNRSGNFAPTANGDWRRRGKVSIAPYGALLTAVVIKVVCAAGITGDFGIFGAQLEEDPGNDAFYFGPSSYIPTTGTAATRAATSIAFSKPSSVTDAESCGGVDIYSSTYDVEGKYSLALAWASGGRIALRYGTGAATTSSISMTDGTNANTVNGISKIIGCALTTCESTRVTSGWRTSDHSTYIKSESNTQAGTYDDATVGTTFCLGMGSGCGFAQPSYWVSNVVLDATETGCQ